MAAKIAIAFVLTCFLIQVISAAVPQDAQPVASDTEASLKWDDALEKAKTAIEGFAKDVQNSDFVKKAFEMAEQLGKDIQEKGQDLFGNFQKNDAPQQ